MKAIRIWLHWELQVMADRCWSIGLLRLGNACCRLGGFVYPASSKADAAQWSGYRND